MKTIFLFLTAVILYGTADMNAQNIRPVKDNVGFCWDAGEMNSFMNWLDANAGKDNFTSQNLIGAISVHDDYLYAGKIYYPLFKRIKAKEVVIFGVTHGSVKKEIGNLQNVLILDEFDKWKGPYSDVGISPLRDLIKAGLSKEDYMVSNKAHEIEHSIEAEIPFLQYYNRSIKITPIMVTQMPFEKMEDISGKLSAIISGYMKKNNLVAGKDIFFLISNDANHYGEDFSNSPYGLDLKAHRLATDNDRRILNENFNGVFDRNKITDITKELWPGVDNEKTPPLWCGRFPIVMGLLTMNKVIAGVDHKKISGKLFRYSDTMTEKVLPVENTSLGLTAIFSPKHWCGWFTLGVYEE